MKKTILALSLTLAVALSAFASDPKVDARILAKFNREFSTASNVKWDVTKEFTRAYFTLNEQGLVVYFDRDGELMSTARNLLFNQLPLSVIQGLQKKFANASYSSIIEVIRDNETSYYMETEQKGKKVLLQSSIQGYVSVVKKWKL